MADLDDLGYISITDMQTDEAIELLRQVRLSRRMPTRQIKTTKAREKATPTVNANEAAELLRILQGDS